MAAQQKYVPKMRINVVEAILGWEAEGTADFGFALLDECCWDFADNYHVTYSGVDRNGRGTRDRMRGRVI
jgi:hypothetical protein